VNVIFSWHALQETGISHIMSVAMQVSQPRLKHSTSQIQVQSLTTTVQPPKFCSLGGTYWVAYLSCFVWAFWNPVSTAQSCLEFSRWHTVQMVMCAQTFAHFVLTWQTARQTWGDSTPAWWRSMQGRCCTCGPATRSQTH
jgi:hypothetical protein